MFDRATLLRFTIREFTTNEDLYTETGTFTNSEKLGL